MNKLHGEMIDKIKEIHNDGIFMKTNSIETDSKTLNAYSNFVTSKANIELLGTIRNYNRVMIGFGLLNLVLFFINIWILSGK